METQMVTIREERPEDIAGIRHVNEAAFERAKEANLVDALRQADAITLSIVAELDGEIVGHILFTPVTIGSESARHPAVALGPMAVLPDYQGKGIGSRLVRAGLDSCTGQNSEGSRRTRPAFYYRRLNIA